MNIFRIVPDNGDARERLIDALKSISKISPSQYSAYKDACKKYASEFARGMTFESWNLAHCVCEIFFFSILSVCLKSEKYASEFVQILPYYR